MENDSYLTFGGLPDFLVQQDLNFLCHRTSGDFHWQLKEHKIRVGDVEIDSYAEMPLMLTDTGTTLTFLTGGIFDQVIKAICAGKECFN